jgi:phage FluMu protein Com
MAPKRHLTPLSGGDRKALAKELTQARAMTTVLARRSTELRAEGEALIRKADGLACESWNEKMWADGGPMDPSPTVEQALNGGHPWLEIECPRCKTKRDVDLATLRRVSTTFIHDLIGRLRCSKCAKAGSRPPATLLQLAQRPRLPAPET